MRPLPKDRTRTSRRSVSPPATASRATATICCRSTGSAKSKSPIFNYPYHYTREALEQAKTRDEWDACHGLKLKFSNPETGDFAMPTIGTFIQLLPKGFKTTRYRATDATVFAAIEGKGRTRIGDQVFEWGARDLFVVPSWHWVTHEADTDAVLFSFSDRPVQQKLDLFREDRGNA